jgi:hypothetical protein
MIGKVWNLLFGCHHRLTTRPITPVSRRDQSTYSYVACLDCGRQFYYDTRNMTMGAPVPLALVPPCHSSSALPSRS